MDIRQAIRKLVESMSRPGLMGAVGKRREKACQKDLAAYFRLLASKLPVEELSKLADGVHKDAAVHTAEMVTRRVVRMCNNTLLGILSTQLLLAYKEGWNNTQVLEHKDLKEATGDSITPTGTDLDFLGPTGQRAADFAATHAAELVKGLDQTTVEIVQDLVSQAIEERLGVGGLARLLRDEIDGMSLDRAKVIATTEMNTAVSTATLEKLQNLGVQYKQWIPVDDPCPICEDNEADGAIPVDETFSSGDDAPPAHPNCRCAVTGARPPEGGQ